MCLAFCCVGLAIYAFRGTPAITSAICNATTATKAPAASAVTTAPERAESGRRRPSLDGDDLEPGVDGGSTDTGLPYYLRRQAVYYRTRLYRRHDRRRPVAAVSVSGAAAGQSLALRHRRWRRMRHQRGPLPHQEQVASGRNGLRRRLCSSAAPIRRASPAAPAIRSAPMRSISKAAFREFTAPTRRNRSARHRRSDASGSSTTTWSTSRSVSLSAPASW